MKIVADENIPFAMEAFGTLGAVTTLAGRSITSEAVREADMLIVRSVTKVNESLLRGSGVGFVGTCTIGMDHVDLEYLTRNRIAFASAPGSNANSVSEYLTAALLVLGKRHGFKLKSKTVGVVGVGNVGSRVVKKCEALGMRTILNDPPLARETGDPKYRPIDEVLEQSDVVTIHVPLTKEDEDATYHMVDEAFIKRMKAGAILINTARGKVQGDQAVLNALKNGHLKAAVLDVWESEPRVNLELLDKVDIATPHIAGYSLDGKVNGTRMVYEAACEFLGVEPLWDPSPHLPKPEHEVLELDCAGREDEDVLCDAVLNIYDILDDDRRMREAIEECEDADERARRFDQLRKTYPERREFQNTQIEWRAKSERPRAKLLGLGFQVTTRR